MEEKEYLKRCLTDKIIKDIFIFFDEIPVNELIDYLVNLMEDDINENRNNTSISYICKLINFLHNLNSNINKQIVN